MLKSLLWILIILMVGANLALGHGEDHKTMPEGSDPKTLKLQKEQLISPKTGLPKTLNPNLFRGKAKKAYQIAKEMPEVLAQMPCFCGCEVFGHENLLDCFIDDHAAG